MILHSESMTKIRAAILAVQQAVDHVDKAATNPHFGSSYTDLNTFLHALRGPMAQAGILMTQGPGMEGDNVIVDTLLIHESGEWIRNRAAAPMQKLDPQGAGSAITYLRRYSLAALFAIPQEDDDGEDASVPTPRPQREQRPQARPSEPNGHKGSNVFDLDSVAGSPQSKAKGQTWRELLATDEGRGFVKWATTGDGMKKLDYAAREVLKAALDAANGKQRASAEQTIKLQDLLNRAANANLVTVDQAAAVENIINDADPKKVADAIHRIEVRMQNAKLAGIGARGDGELAF